MQETTIKGHGYQCIPYNFREGVEIQLALGGILGNAATPVIEFAATLPAFGGSEMSDADANKQGNPAIFRALLGIPQGIVNEGGPEFVERLLSGTSRGIDIQRGENPAPVMTPLCGDCPGGGSWLDVVYPGNWGELYLAISWVLAVNFSPFGRTPSWSWRTLWDELQGSIPQLSTLNFGTDQPSAAGSTDKTPPTP